MSPLHWGTSVALGAVGLVVGALLSAMLLMLGYSPIVVTPWLGALFLVLSVVLWLGGREVRRLKERKRSRLNAVQASRVAFFARSTVLNGAVFTGFLAGVAGIALFRLWAPATASSAWGAGISALSAFILAIVATIVERWCIDDSDEGEQTQRRRSKRGPEAATS